MQLVLALALTAFSLFLALRGVNFAEVSQALRQVNGYWLLLSVGLIMVTLTIRAQRWRVLLKRQLSFRDAFGLINIGYLVNGVLPARAGDAARGVAGSLRGPVTMLAALSTVVVERVLDMLVIVLILVATLPFVPGLRQYLATGSIGGGIPLNLVVAASGLLSLGIVAALVIMAAYPAKVEAIVQRVLEKLPIAHPERLLRPVQHILEGLSALGSVRAGIEIVLWTLALWATTGLYFWAVMRACGGFIAEASLLKSLVAMWSSAFGMVFPATGGIGSFHFAVREALFWGFALPRDLGLTYAVLSHAIAYLLGIALGAGALLSWGISLREVMRHGSGATDQEQEPQAPPELQAQVMPEVAAEDHPVHSS